MKTPTGKQAVRLVSARLAELLGVAAEAADVQASSAGGDGAARVAVAGFEFAVQWGSSGAAATVDSAAALAVERAGAAGEKAIPLVAVPFMGDVGRERCAAAGAAWLDLSGNALIMAPGLRIRVEGQPNRFKRPGRPSSAFAPKSARIARWPHSGRYHEAASEAPPRAAHARRGLAAATPGSCSPVRYRFGMNVAARA